MIKDLCIKYKSILQQIGDIYDQIGDRYLFWHNLIDLRDYIKESDMPEYNICKRLISIQEQLSRQTKFDRKRTCKLIHFYLQIRQFYNWDGSEGVDDSDEQADEA